ncbi:MAG TPA: hypothetical protein VFD88_05395 [Clostridia bacterium]|nr:hypothetical protein [Clostridia bacterium]
MSRVQRNGDTNVASEDRHVTGAGLLWELSPAFVVAFLVSILFSPGNVRFETPVIPTIENFAATGRLGIDDVALASQGLFVKGTDGLYYPVHEFGATVAALPVAKLLHAVPAIRRRGFRQLLELALCFQGAFYAGITAALFWYCLVHLLDVRRREATFATLGLSCGTQLLVYGGNAVDVMLAVPMLLGCVALLLSTERHPTLAKSFGLALLAGFVPFVKASLGTYVAGVSIAWLALVLDLPARLARRNARPISRPVAHLALYAAAIVPGALSALAVNFRRTGNPLKFSYPWPMSQAFDFHRMVTSGLPGTFVSPGRGLFLFTPILLLVPWGFSQVWKRLPAQRLPLFASLFGFFCALAWLSGCWFWTSLGGWGIRYYVPYLPVLLLPLGCSLQWMTVAMRRVAGALCGLGFVVNASGTVTNYIGHFCAVGDYERPWELYNTPAYAVVCAFHNLERLVGINVPVVSCPGASEISIQASNHLYTWWYSLRYFGLRPAFSTAIAVVLGAMAVSSVIAWVRRDVGSATELGAGRG